MNLRMNLKKILSILVIALVAIVAVGCKDKETETDEDNAVKQASKIYLQTNDAYLNDIPLPRFVQGNKEAKITWASSDITVVEVTEYEETDEKFELYFLGKVNLPEEQKAVTLTATITYKGEKATKKFNLKVGNSYEEMSIEDAKAAKDATRVKIAGTVVFVADTGYAIKDETGYMYMYTNTVKHGRKVGEKVVVRGETDIYNMMPQIANSASMVVGNEPVGYNPADEAEEATIAKLVSHDLKDKMFYTTMFKVTGKLRASTNTNSPYEIYSANNYDEYIGVSKYTSAASVDVMKKFIGKNVEATVIVYDNRNGNFSVLFQDVDPVEVPENLTDADKALVTYQKVAASFKDVVVTGNIALATTDEEHNATLEWTSSNETIISNTGVVVIPDEDTVVTLTVKVTVGVEVHTGTIELNVKKLTKSKVSALVAQTPSKASDPKVLVLFEGEVIAHQFKGYWVADETGAMLVYTNKANSETEPYPAIGTIVSVKGNLTTFGEANSFTSQVSPLDVKVVENGTNPTIIPAVTKTFEELLALNIDSYEDARNAGLELYGKYITITGKVDGSGNFWWIRGTEANHIFRLNNLYSNTGLVKDETVTITVLVRDFYFIDDTSSYNNYKQGTIGGVFFGTDAIQK